MRVVHHTPDDSPCHEGDVAIDNNTRQLLEPFLKKQQKKKTVTPQPTAVFSPLPTSSCLPPPPRLPSFLPPPPPSPPKPLELKVKLTTKDDDVWVIDYDAFGTLFDEQPTINRFLCFQ